jgi:putative transcriptional regulator
VGKDGGGDGFVSAPTLRGRLLVALPPLVDENFDRTVVLMLEHTEAGALGVVLNRPGARTVDSVLEQWSPYATPPSVLFEGGPVETESVIGLALSDPEQESPAWAPAFDGIGTIDLSVFPDEQMAPVHALRLFSGYAGWAPSQLENEIDVGAWVVADFVTDDAFGSEPGALWRSVLRRQGGRMAWMANYPDEPALN